jgi:hypothetical protein
MTRLRVTTSLLAAMALLMLLTVAASSALADDDRGRGGRGARARLDGYQEAPQTLSTAGHGDFRARINDNSIEFTLRYDGLEGTTTAAHIHLGRPALTGGIIVHFCGTGGRAPCPQSASGPTTVSFTITPADVVGPAGQGIAPGEFAELVRAIRAGATYVNVHSSLYPGGEIRGLVEVDGDRD